MGQLVNIEREAAEPAGLRFVGADGQLLGKLTARHELSRLLSDGQSVLHCSVNSATAVSAADPFGGVNVRIVTGSSGEVYEPPRPRSYPVGIVGESQYQAAIIRCRVGDRVRLWHEADNPHDGLALVAKTGGGETIGYVPRDCWLRDAVHEEGRGATASIMSLHPGPAIAVVLEVTLGREPIEIARYGLPTTVRASKDVAGRPKGWLARLLGW